MKIVKDILKLNETGEVSIAMGNFDGVHLGHQSLLKNALIESNEKGIYLHKNTMRCNEVGEEERKTGNAKNVY